MVKKHNLRNKMCKKYESHAKIYKKNVTKTEKSLLLFMQKWRKYWTANPNSLKYLQLLGLVNSKYKLFVKKERI